MADLIGQYGLLENQKRVLLNPILNLVREVSLDLLFMV